jgi:hypothetical protein
VHVVNGDSVARTLAQSRLGGAVIVWRDVLHEGPVPPGDPAVVRAARAAFLAQAGYGSAEAILADLAAADAALVAALAAGRETVLWFEHDLHDQLQLIQILSRIADCRGRASARLISIDRHPAHARFTGLGELSAEELADLWSQRRPIEEETFASATRVYESFRRGDAGDLAASARELAPDRPGDTGRRCHPGLPYLAAAINRLLEESPWAGAGPGRSERQILRAVASGAHTPAEVFGATQAMEEAPYAGDSWTFRRVDELVGCDRPLLARGADGLRLTPAGQAALDDVLDARV